LVRVKFHNISLVISFWCVLLYLFSQNWISQCVGYTT